MAHSCYSAQSEPSVHALTASSFSPCNRRVLDITFKLYVSTCQLYMARRDIRMEDTPRFRTFALQRRIDIDTTVGFAGICGGIRGLPFDRGWAAFLVGGRRPWRWRRRVSPLWKSGQTVSITLQRLVPLATTEQIVSLLFEFLCLAKLSLYRSNAYRSAMEARYL